MRDMNGLPSKKDKSKNQELLCISPNNHFLSLQTFDLFHSKHLSILKTQTGASS